MSAAAMNHRVDTCPDLETIAAFIDGRVDEPTRDAIAAHLTSCDACYFLLAQAADLQPAAAAKPAVVEPLWRRPAARWSAAALATAAAALLAGGGGFWRAADDIALDELVAAVGTERLIEPRLTGGFAYGPMRATTRSGHAFILVAPPDVRIAAARIEQATTAQSTPTAFQARGVAALVTGDVDRAITALEAALAAAAESGADARVLNDLAAGYLVEAQRSADTSEISRALATLNRAIAIDPNLPEALFNRAIALERLSLTSQARDAWQTYLASDESSPWAEEARHRLRQLSLQP